MASSNAVRREEIEPDQSWPRGFSHDPELSIGAVTEIIAGEFPATSVSKIRFLEDKGLIKPHRSPSGYRKYSRADVERIRFILAQQRDSWAPLKVIGDQLRALDAGHDIEPVPTARLVASEGKTVIPRSQETLSARELSDLTGVATERLEEYAQLGLIVPDLGGYFLTRTVSVVNLIVMLENAGIPARVLRSVRQGAERSADIVDQVITSRENRTKPGERERSRAQAADLSQLFGRLHQELLAVAVEKLSHT
ncbi:MerR family transcriptional regulator [Scrofimicrobium sp. R131]|uniref:MerR family transcriptional regulator n=1 Tax=Scrofimicrobium appendicitidis TaxID=3079930 RepID=A0AAU7V4A5_9ACTO